MKSITVVLKEDTALSLDGVNSQVYKKGEKIQSQNHFQARILSNIAESGKASVAGASSAEKEEVPKKEAPKQKKVTKRAKS